MSRTLLVSPVRPDPRGSGLQQRAFHLLTKLAGRSQVVLAVAMDEPWVADPEVDRLIEDCILIPVLRSTTTLALALPLLVLIRRSWTSDWLVPIGPLSRLSVDAVVVFRLRSHDIAYRLAPSASSRTMDLDDLESRTLLSIAGLALRRGRLRLAAKTFSTACQYHLLERTLLQQYNCITLAKQEDADRLALPSDKIRIEPNAVVIPPLPAYSPGAPFTLLFTGTLGYYPNVDAALWIAEKIVPALRRTLRKPFRVRIAGRGADKKLREALSVIPEIEFLGEVVEIERLYREAHGFLAAVRGGGGTKVKVLEAFAQGCPVIATPHAMEGQPCSSLLLASTPQQFADQALLLQSDPTAAAELAARAYAQLKASSSNAGSSSTSTPPSSR